MGLGQPVASVELDEPVVAPHVARRPLRRGPAERRVVLPPHVGRRAAPTWPRPLSGPPADGGRERPPDQAAAEGPVPPEGAGERPGFAHPRGVMTRALD